MFKFQLAIFVFISLFGNNKTFAFNTCGERTQDIHITDDYYFKLPLVFKLDEPEVSNLYNDGFTYIQFHTTDTAYDEYRKNMESCSKILKKLLKRVETSWLTNDNFKIEGLKNHIYSLKESRTYFDEMDDCLLILECIIDLAEVGTALIAIKVTGYDSRFETFEERVTNAKNLLKSIRYSPELVK